MSAVSDYRTNISMLRSSNVIGNPVLTTDKNRFATVLDLIFDPRHESLEGFLVARGGWTGETRVLPWKSVLQVDQDAVVAKTKDSVIAATQTSIIKRLLEDGHNVHSMEVWLPHEEVKGMVEDLYFNPVTGKIERYVIRIIESVSPYMRYLYIPAPVSFQLEALPPNLVIPSTTQVPKLVT